MSAETKALEQDVDPMPACPIAKQCSEKNYRDVPARLVAGTFEPCGNPECFPDADSSGDVDPDEIVVVSRGRASKHMHKPANQNHAHGAEQ